MYDSDVQTIANDVHGVPLLWMAMFRARDMVSKQVEIDGETLRVDAPIVERTTAIAQLQESAAYFNILFQGAGGLDEYVELLKRALESVDYEFVTIEMDEIAFGGDPAEFYDDFHRLLDGIGNDYSEEARQCFLSVAAFDEKFALFPPANLLLDQLEGFDESDAWNHCRVMGAGGSESGIGRFVPWEIND